MYVLWEEAWRHGGGLENGTFSEDDVSCCTSFSRQAILERAFASVSSVFFNLISKASTVNSIMRESIHTNN